MNIGAKTEYACIAVLELAARHDSDQPVRIRDIADAHGVPSRFLVQILLQLKAAGLVLSTRGAAGGYRLAKEPSEISLLDVMRVIEGSLGETPSSAAGNTQLTRTLWNAWKQVAAAEREMLAGINFAELAASVRGSSDSMYHI